VYPFMTTCSFSTLADAATHPLKLSSNVSLNTGSSNCVMLTESKIRADATDCSSRTGSETVGASDVGDPVGEYVTVGDTVGTKVSVFVGANV